MDILKIHFNSDNHIIPLNFVVIGESDDVGSYSLTETEVEDVISTATKDGGSGGLAWANPSTSLFKVFALLPQTIACFSVSPPAQPVIITITY